MPSYPCIADPLCPNPATHRGRCDEHERERERARNEEPKRAERRKVWKRRRWERARASYLARHPLCNRCQRIATDVHHIIDTAEGGAPWDEENFEALCHPCHGRESMSRISHH